MSVAFFAARRRRIARDREAPGQHRRVHAEELRQRGRPRQPASGTRRRECRSSTRTSPAREREHAVAEVAPQRDFLEKQRVGTEGLAPERARTPLRTPARAKISIARGASGTPSRTRSGSRAPSSRPRISPCARLDEPRAAPAGSPAAETRRPRSTPPPASRPGGPHGRRRCGRGRAAAATGTRAPREAPRTPPRAQSRCRPCRSRGAPPRRSPGVRGFCAGSATSRVAHDLRGVLEGHLRVEARKQRLEKSATRARRARGRAPRGSPRPESAAPTAARTMSFIRNARVLAEPEVEERIVVARLVEPRDRGRARAQLDRRVGGARRPARNRARSTARSSSSPAGTTRSTRPIASARSDRDVLPRRRQALHLARADDVAERLHQARRHRTPRMTSERPNLPLPSAAMRSSARHRRDQPAGDRVARQRRDDRRAERRRSGARGRSSPGRTAPSPARSRSTSSGRSQPAENMPGRADARTTPRALACAASAAESSATSSGENALAFGRFEGQDRDLVAGLDAKRGSSAPPCRSAGSKSSAVQPAVRRSAPGETSRPRRCPAARAPAPRRAARRTSTPGPDPPDPRRADEDGRQRSPERRRTRPRR